jgi:Flp pilus assembly CpaF family ATPase/pSer/pThr/pTyr-binding forkhead associated (FHA) protein
MAKLRIVAEDLLGHRLAEVEPGASPLVIGREPGCQIRLESPYVSKRHAEIRPAGGGFAVRPFGVNGTFVNQQRLREGEERTLRSGDVVTVPGFILKVITVGATATLPGRSLVQMRRFSELKAGLHTELLRKVDLRTLSGRDVPEEQRREKIHTALDEILNAGFEVTSDLTEFIAAEALRGALVDRLLRSGTRSGAGDGEPELAGWYRKPLERAFAGVVDTCAREIAAAIGEAPLRDRIRAIDERFDVLFARQRPSLPPDLLGFIVKRKVRRDLEDLVFGLGPLEDLLRMPDLNEIMVVGRDRIFVEAGGGLEETGRSFPGNDGLEVVIGRIVAPIGRFVNRAQPIVDARLADGSRVNIVIPPVAIHGPAITIRKFRREPFSTEELVDNGTLNGPAMRFLCGCVVARKNMILSGGTGSGKTSLLNTMASQIPPHERIVVIEDAAELQLRQPNLVSLEAKRANVEGEGEIAIRDLVRNALRMRPDRIIVGECRGKEALDMLQAMNTGHDGSLTTAHANSPREMISRLEVMVLEAGEDLPIQAIDRQIGGALDVIVQIRRRRDGRRRVTAIAEVLGYDAEEGTVVLEDIFRLGDEESELRFTGYLPTFIDDMERSGTRPEDLWQEPAP